MKNMLKMLNRYSEGLKMLHWLNAGLLLMIILCGLLMRFLPHGTTKQMIATLHISFGVILLITLIFRAYIRLFYNRRVVNNKSNNRLHICLYSLMFAMCCSGYLLINSFGHSVGFFGAFDLPKIIMENHVVGEVFETLHKLLSYFIIICITIHIMRNKSNKDKHL